MKKHVVTRKGLMSATAVDSPRENMPPEKK